MPDATCMMDVDPVTVEVVGNALASIADEMGETLVRASYSTNIKERRDCSTVLFEADGRTLCQAEHIPIHLGSLMGVVETILDRHDVTDFAEGDMFIGNEAYIDIWREWPGIQGVTDQL